MCYWWNGARARTPILPFASCVGATFRLRSTCSIRPSAVLGTIFGQKMEYEQSLTLFAFLVAGLFLIVQLASIMVGVSMTRTITGAVHELYEGTQKVKVGDFSHRIAVRGNDQLAELNVSFNRMTENLERLIAVEKEE